MSTEEAMTKERAFMELARRSFNESAEAPAFLLSYKNFAAGLNLFTLWIQEFERVRSAQRMRLLEFLHYWMSTYPTDLSSPDHKRIIALLSLGENYDEAVLSEFKRLISIQNTTKLKRLISRHAQSTSSSSTSSPAQSPSNSASNSPSNSLEDIKSSDNIKSLLQSPNTAVASHSLGAASPKANRQRGASMRNWLQRNRKGTTGSELQSDGSLGSDAREPAKSKLLTRGVSESGSIAMTASDASPFGRDDLDLLTLNSIDIARELTMIEFDCFKSIGSRELLNQGWQKENKHILAPNITRLITKFNEVSYWVTTEILKRADPREQGRVIAKFIKTARICYQLYNFNSLSEILTGLNNGAVIRLKMAWFCVSDRSMKQFQQLDQLMQPQSNYLNYRHEIRRLTFSKREKRPSAVASSSSSGGLPTVSSDSTLHTSLSCDELFSTVRGGSGIGGAQDPLPLPASTSASSLVTTTVSTSSSSSPSSSSLPTSVSISPSSPEPSRSSYAKTTAHSMLLLPLSLGVLDESSPSSSSSTAPSSGPAPLLSPSSRSRLSNFAIDHGPLLSHQTARTRPENGDNHNNDDSKGEDHSNNKNNDANGDNNDNNNGNEHNDGEPGVVFPAQSRRVHDLRAVDSPRGGSVKEDRSGLSPLRGLLSPRNVPTWPTGEAPAGGGNISASASFPTITRSRTDEDQTKTSSSDTLTHKTPLTSSSSFTGVPSSSSSSSSSSPTTTTSAFTAPPFLSSAAASAASGFASRGVPPILPYLAIILRDFIAVSEGNAAYTTDGRVNAHLIELQYQIVGELRSFQANPYSLPRKEGVRRFLESLQYEDDDDVLYDMSLKSCPPAAATALPDGGTAVTASAADEGMAVGESSLNPDRAREIFDAAMNDDSVSEVVKKDQAATAAAAAVAPTRERNASVAFYAMMSQGTAGMLEREMARRKLRRDSAAGVDSHLRPGGGGSCIIIRERVPSNATLSLSPAAAASAFMTEIVLSSASDSEQPHQPEAYYSTTTSDSELDWGGGWGSGASVLTSAASSSLRVDDGGAAAVAAWGGGGRPRSLQPCGLMEIDLGLLRDRSNSATTEKQKQHDEEQRRRKQSLRQQQQEEEKKKKGKPRKGGRSGSFDDSALHEHETRRRPTTGFSDDDDDYNDDDIDVVRERRPRQNSATSDDDGSGGGGGGNSSGGRGARGSLYRSTSSASRGKLQLLKERIFSFRGKVDLSSSDGGDSKSGGGSGTSTPPASTSELVSAEVATAEAAPLPSTGDHGADEPPPAEAVAAVVAPNNNGSNDSSKKAAGSAEGSHVGGVEAAAAEKKKKKRKRKKKARQAKAAEAQPPPEQQQEQQPSRPAVVTRDRAGSVAFYATLGHGAVSMLLGEGFLPPPT